MESSGGLSVVQSGLGEHEKYNRRNVFYANLTINQNLEDVCHDRKLCSQRHRFEYTTRIYCK